MPRMTDQTVERVKADSLLTLHYRIASRDDVELISTFGGNPATLQLGSGELAPTLETWLVDLPVGEHHVFLLESQQAFGAHDPALVRRIARQELPDNAPLEVHGMIEFSTPDGSKYAGFVRELDASSALIDFNHPLAGKAIRFEALVIGVL
jgi:FKBP-type peptidyl-prolyl cis-trans isomerase SlpA